jgi:hypothetical protein
MNFIRSGSSGFAIESVSKVTNKLGSETKTLSTRITSFAYHSIPRRIEIPCKRLEVWKFAF